MCLDQALNQLGDPPLAPAHLVCIDPPFGLQMHKSSRDSGSVAPCDKDWDTEAWRGEAISSAQRRGGRLHPPQPHSNHLGISLPNYTRSYPGVLMGAVPQTHAMQNRAFSTHNHILTHNRRHSTWEHIPIILVLVYQTTHALTPAF